MLHIAYPQEAFHLEGGIVAHPDAQNLAITDKGVEGPQDLLLTGGRIIVMKKEDINIVGAKTLQALMQGVLQVFCRTTLCIDIVSHRSIRFGGDHHLVALSGYEGAQVLFSNTFLIDIGTVEEVDALLPAHAVHPLRLFLIRP